MTVHFFDVDAAGFQAQVIDASHDVPVLVDFWAEWCAPCRTLKPLLENLAGEYGGRFRLAKVDSDRNPELAARFGVRGIPDVKAFVAGQPVDEFTGALPEARLREFIDRLLPSPAEPLRIAAGEARARGDFAVAASLLADALELDPSAEAAHLDLAELQIDMHELDAARTALDRLDEHTARDPVRLAALRARMKLATAGAGADRRALAARVSAAPDDFDARLHLAGALALAHEYRPALEELMEIVRRDRKWRDEAARRTLLDLFTLLGSDAAHEALVREFRIRLARTLN